MVIVVRVGGGATYPIVINSNKDARHDLIQVAGIRCSVSGMGGVIKVLGGS